jgi:hypothetical protein
MSHRFPKVVPLLEVPDYTKHIEFGRLDLPAGLDQERLEVHLRAIEQVRLLGGLGRLEIAGAYEHGVGSLYIDADKTGSAVIGNSLNLDSDPSATGQVHIVGASSTSTEGVIFSEAVSSQVKVNLDKRERLAREAEDPAHAALDPEFHANFLNRSIKRGLIEASLKANADITRLMKGTAIYSYFAINEAVLGVGLIPSIAINLAARPFWVNFIGALPTTPGIEKKLREEFGDDIEVPGIRHRLTSIRQSLFFGVSLDRLAMGAGTAAVRTFVTARAEE